MRNFLLLLLLALSIELVAQTPATADLKTKVWELKFGYQQLQPSGEATRGMRAVHGMHVSGGARVLNKKVLVALDLGVNLMSKLGGNVEWEMNGSTAKGSVQYNGNFFSYGINTSYSPIDKGIFNVYISGGAGRLKFDSDIRLYDEMDDACELISNTTILQSATNFFAAGVGASVGGKWHRDENNKFFNRVRLDVSVRYMMGGQMQFLDIRQLQDPGIDISDETKPLTMEFIDVTTNNIHTHKVAYIQTSALRMLNFNVGLAIAFASTKKKMTTNHYKVQ